MIKKFIDFNSDKLSYYAFDIDNNLLNMSTKIHMEINENDKWNSVDVSTSKFAEIRNSDNYRLLENNPTKAFADFRDNIIFLKDFKEAIDNKNFAYSWNAFLECLTSGSLFALITARGNKKDAFKKAVEYTIDNVLNNYQRYTMYENCTKFVKLFLYQNSDFPAFDILDNSVSQSKLVQLYLDNCYYYGVTSDKFIEKFGDHKTEEAKKLALNEFIDICHDYGENSNSGISFGFSDDDKCTVEYIKEHFKNISAIKVYMKLSVHDTSIPDNCVVTAYKEGKIVETLGNGLDGSLIKFNSFNSMPRTLQNATNDFSGYNLQQKAKVATGMYKDTFVKGKKKILKKKRKANK
jgi:hypothetical protein